MKSVSDPASLEQLIDRLGALHPDSERKWGTLTASEMLCHLGDATASVLSRGAKESESGRIQKTRARPVMKWIALRSPLAWPPGLKTPPSVDPHAEGTRPTDFEADRQRAIDGLRAFAAAPAEAFAVAHGAFGRMSMKDWHRWAYRHTDHHLRQFGL